MFKIFILPFILILYLITPIHDLNPELYEEIRLIDEESPGTLGLYIKNLEDGQIVNYNADRNWYLASTVKIPLAIAILQKVEEGEFSLADELTLRESDKVDGSGDLIWQEAGSTHTIETLIDKMLRNSDSTATDMLIRFVGEEELNRQIRENISDGLEPITTILQVRYDAYSEVHENAANLSNTEIIGINGVSALSDRLNELLRVMSVDVSELQADSIVEAFERYYDRGLNSGRLDSMGLMLERLAEGEYLTDLHTEFILDVMSGVTTGDRRIKAGFPDGVRFAHKTGTQIGRACNTGIVYPPNGNKPIIVAACIEQHLAVREAEIAFEKVGRSLAETWLH